MVGDAARLARRPGVSAVTYGGPPPADEVRIPEGIIVTAILAPPRYPVWPWTTDRMRRKIGWVMYEVHPAAVSPSFMVYAK